jgi:putative glutamine amidotransferase
MAPIIGITTSQGSNSHHQDIILVTRAYVSAILEAGGVPVLIPSLLSHGDWTSLFTRLDGILFSGGGDISVDRFGGTPHARIDGMDAARDVLELGLLRAAVSGEKPFLGICRGCQLVNVALGGTLFTHIPDQLPGALDHDHPGDQRKILVHAVKVEEGTKVSEVLGETVVKVNSHHHQGLKDIGSGLRVAGRSPDGLVEAVELPGHPFGLAVQWHPEWLTDQSHARNLFLRFVDAARVSEARAENA